MSGQLNRPANGAVPTPAVGTTGPRPLLEPTQAAELLEEVIYERVLGTIDLDELFGFEQELWSELAGLEGVDEDQIPELAKQMIDRALLRVIDDPRRYMDMDDSVFGPDGECKLCAEEGRQNLARAAAASNRPKD